MVTQQGTETAVLVSQAQILTRSPSIYWTLRCLQQNVISLNHMLYIHRLSCWKNMLSFCRKDRWTKWASVYVMLQTASSQEWELSLKPAPHPPAPTGGCSVPAAVYDALCLITRKDGCLAASFNSTPHTFVFQAHRSTLEYHSHLLSLSWKDLTANILLLYMTLICSWTLSTITG